MIGVPVCLCGKNHWGQHDGELGGPFSQCSVVCEECGREGLYLRCKKNLLFIGFVTTEETRDRVDSDYVQRVLLPHWQSLDQQSKQPDGTSATLPPQIPEGQVIYIRDGDDGDWTKVNRDDTLKLDLPGLPPQSLSQAAEALGL